MNDTITDLLHRRTSERCEKGDALPEAFSPGTALRSQRLPAEVFSAVDNCFSRGGSLIYEEIDLSGKASIVDLGSFYTEVYTECFPNENERESFNNLLYYLQQAKGSQAYRYHIIIAKDEGGTIIGGAIFDYFKKTNAGVIEFLAVKSDRQSAGIGTMIYDYIQTVLNSDAFDLGQQSPSHIFCEIDAPAYSKASIKKYLYFWDKHGFKHIDMAYIQPALSHDQSAVDGLWLTVMCTHQARSSISRQYVLDFISDYMEYSMQIESPHTDPSYVFMEDSTNQQESIPLKRIV